MPSPSEPQAPISGAVRIRQSGLSSRRVDDEIVILDLDQSRYLTLGGSGAALFDLLQQGSDVEGLVAALLASYDVDEDTARRDVDAFVDQLRQANLLEGS